jgi:Amt family ammonium transporter
MVEWFHKGRPSVLGAASGMVAGLATITPASGFVTVPAAFGIGLAAGVVCYLAVTKLKAKFSYDDSLDVFGVHAVGSITGMLMLGFLANTMVNPAIASTFQANGVTVSLAGGAGQFANQLKAVLFTVAFAGIASFILLQIVNRLVGLRVDVEDEDAGLDLTQHGERAYSE